MRFISSALILLLSACSGPTPDDTGSDVDTGSAGDTRTLATCGGTAADDVPDFFKTWFHCSDLSMDGDTVVIATMGLPPHPSHYWGEGDPNYAVFDYDRGDDYHPNPNTLAAQSFTVRVPANPTAKGITVTAEMVDTTANTSDDEYTMGPAGIAVDSVLIFNDQAGPGDDINDEKFTFDDYNGHPAPGGAYHYHTASPGPLEVSAAVGLPAVEVFGVMCDGTLLFGCTELDGSAPVQSELDAQNGHRHDIGDGTTTHFADRYHAHVCEGFAHGFTPEIQFYDSCQ